jgi:hypothetical protein
VTTPGAARATSIASELRVVAFARFARAVVPVGGVHAPAAPRAKNEATTTPRDAEAVTCGVAYCVEEAATSPPSSTSIGFAVSTLAYAETQT